MGCRQRGTCLAVVGGGQRREERVTERGARTSKLKLSGGLSEPPDWSMAATLVLHCVYTFQFCLYDVDIKIWNAMVVSCLLFVHLDYTILFELKR